MYQFCTSCSHYYSLFLIIRVYWIWNILIFSFIFFSNEFNLSVNCILIYSDIVFVTKIVQHKACLHQSGNCSYLSSKYSPSCFKVAKCTFNQIPCSSQEIVEDHFFITGACLLLFHAKGK